MATPVIEIADAPLFVSVTGFGPPLSPTLTLAQLKLAGATVAALIELAAGRISSIRHNFAANAIDDRSPRCDRFSAFAFIVVLAQDCDFRSSSS
jgi:hypothetical protein